MNRNIPTDKNMLEMNSHGDYGFPITLLYITLSAYKFGRFNCHWHPEIEIIAILEGSMIYQVNQQVYTLTENNCLFVNSNSLHSGSMYKDSDCKYISITFNPVLIYSYEKSAIHTKYVEPIIDSESFTSCLLDGSSAWHKDFFTQVVKLGELFSSSSCGYELLAKGILCSLWNILYTDFYNHLDSTDNVLTPKSQITRLKKALQFIHSNYEAPITLDEMAASCHISKSEFCRIFKKTMHQTPFEYLLRYRIQKSLPLLMDDAYTITETAAKAGFSGSSYYSEVFRKYMRCSPREYVKLQENSGTKAI